MDHPCPEVLGLEPYLSLLSLDPVSSLLVTVSFMKVNLALVTFEGLVVSEGIDSYLI